jgi:hypothetical protein
VRRIGEGAIRRVSRPICCRRLIWTLEICLKKRLDCSPWNCFAKEKLDEDGRTVAELGL